MPSPALFLILATLLPLASFVLLVFLGKRMGKPLAGWVATAAIGLGFVCSIMAMVYWVNGGKYIPQGESQLVNWGKDEGAINLTYKWVPVGGGLKQDHPGFMDVGVFVDSLTIVMFAMVTLVSTLIHIFSIGYMAEDKRFPRFFTYLSLFCFSMLGLTLGGTILQLFIFWELVGLCSYLLIGFWYEKKSASNAAIKAFVVNRVGDFGFLIGLGILFYHVGNVSLPDLWDLLHKGAATGTAVSLSNGTTFSAGLLTVMGIGLFFGAVGKSAQFPLHVWLPDAMEGPTPVSALIHAATMVAAGVYLVGRIFPILTPDARLFVAIIGVTTLTMAALIAIAQSDIKKVLAYSTLSQLGYMILAMGIGSWIGGLFHLITHAFFKALLFLGSGSVIHAMHHEQEMPKYGGLWRKVPVTAFTFGIAVLAISGVPWLSGYYSKEMILKHAGAFASLGSAISKYYWLFFILPAIIAYVTAFYMTRCWMLTFWGKTRNPHAYDHAHESPVMYGPLVVLAVFAVVAGYQGLTNIREMIESSIKENSPKTGAVAEVRSGPFAQVWPVPPEETAGEPAEPKPKRPAASQTAMVAASHEIPPQAISADEKRAREAMHAGITAVEHYAIFAPLGILIGFLLYFRGYAVANMLMRITPLRWIHTWLYRRMYFDELYMGIFVAFTVALSRLGRAFDTYVIDGIVNSAGRAVKGLSFIAGRNDQIVVDGAVNGAASAAQAIGAVARAPQTGRIRLYVLALFGMIVLGVIAIVMLSFWNA